MTRTTLRVVLVVLGVVLVVLEVVLVVLEAVLQLLLLQLLLLQLLLLQLRALFKLPSPLGGVVFRQRYKEPPIKR